MLTNNCRMKSEVSTAVLSRMPVGQKQQELVVTASQIRRMFAESKDAVVYYLVHNTFLVGAHQMRVLQASIRMIQERRRNRPKDWSGPNVRFVNMSR